MKSVKGSLWQFDTTSVFTDLGGCYCICEKSSVKPTKWFQRTKHVILETASTDVTQRLSCIVGNVGARF